MKCAIITAQARSAKDFELLILLLEALGFRSGELEQYENFCVKPFFPPELILEVVHRNTPRAYPDLELMISDPGSAIEIIKKMGIQLVGNDDSSVFDVYLPDGTSIRFKGFWMAGKEPAHGGSVEGTLDGSGKSFGIVVSRFNSFITERLLAGAVDGLLRSGVNFRKGYEIVRVPGSFEIPSAARSLAETKKYDAIICLGCLLRGDTAHYDVIVNEVTRGIGQSAQETGVPHAFGVLTCDTLEQAIDRAGLKMGNKGFEAALAAVEMANLKSALSRRSSAVRKSSSGLQATGFRKSNKRSGKRKPNR